MVAEPSGWGCCRLLSPNLQEGNMLFSSTAGCRLAGADLLVQAEACGTVSLVL